MEAPPQDKSGTCSSLDGLAHGLSEIMNKKRFSNY